MIIKIGGARFVAYEPTALPHQEAVADRGSLVSRVSDEGSVEVVETVEAVGGGVMALCQESKPVSDAFASWVRLVDSVLRRGCLASWERR